MSDSFSPTVQWFDPAVRIPRRNQTVWIRLRDGRETRTTFRVVHTADWPSGASWEFVDRGRTQLPFEDATAWREGDFEEGTEIVEVEPTTDTRPSGQVALHQEIQIELTATGLFLARLQDHTLEWRPHPNVWSVGELSGHLVRLIDRIILILRETSFNLEEERLVSPVGSRDEALASFEAGWAVIADLLPTVDGNALKRMWTLRSAEGTVFTRPRGDVLRSYGVSQLVHFRGQLALLFGTLGIEAPPIYELWSTAQCDEPPRPLFAIPAPAEAMDAPAEPGEASGAAPASAPTVESSANPAPPASQPGALPAEAAPAAPPAERELTPDPPSTPPAPAVTVASRAPAPSATPTSPPDQDGVLQITTGPLLSASTFAPQDAPAAPEPAAPETAAPEPTAPARDIPEGWVDELIADDVFAPDPGVALGAAGAPDAEPEPLETAPAAASPETRGPAEAVYDEEASGADGAPALAAAADGSGHAEDGPEEAEPPATMSPLGDAAELAQFTAAAKRAEAHGPAPDLREEAGVEVDAELGVDIELANAVRLFDSADVTTASTEPEAPLAPELVDAPEPAAEADDTPEHGGATASDAEVHDTPEAETTPETAPESDGTEQDGREPASPMAGDEQETMIIRASRSSPATRRRRRRRSRRLALQNAGTPDEDA